ncbi:MAG: double-strand break repair protein AddB [Roseovarius sp.]
MFDPSESPRLFTVPLGVDFPKALVSGLLARSTGDAPEALARVQLVVNTRRMARRVRALFDAGPPVLLPSIRLVTDLSSPVAAADLPPPVSPLRRRLELVQLVSRLLDAQPDLAPRSALYDLADSLARLMDEMRDEGVPTEAIEALKVEDQSGHWARIKAFLGIVRDYFEQSEELPDTEARRRLAIERLIASWQTAPPDHPVIVAGSTGSRGTTRMLLEAVARLPQGAVVLPGFDTDMPADVWERLLDAKTAEDHPQYRFALLCRNLGLSPGALPAWSDEAPANPARNRVTSLALRPAPVTDQWLRDGQSLTEMQAATEAMTLIEAPSTRIEALTIAMRLRAAVEEGRTAALITPDRTLTRQVAAALDRWDIVPDDSAGTPLHLSPPGRFLRHVAELFTRPLSAESLLTLLKHPLSHSGADRGPHVRLSNELELHLRRNGPPYPDAKSLHAWAEPLQDPHAPAWVAWVIECFTSAEIASAEPLEALVARHRILAERIAQGPAGTGSGQLWEREAGRQVLALVEDLAENAGYGGAMHPRDYTALFHSLLSAEQVRSIAEPHPGVLIWGTLEARVQGADLLILAGLNDGTWPEPPAPDPWLNRDLRLQAGLLLPERRIGLSAHDFQQAIAAPEVWLTRSIRSDDAETVPSRWLNRLQNLMKGLPQNGGAEAWAQMQKRGAHWLALAERLEEPGESPPARRPSPRPPRDARPKKLSVTEIKRLIRDPYAIYAKHVLNLRPLDPLMKLPDALLRGIVVHEALEAFIRDSREDPALVTPERLLAATQSALDAHVPWAEARAIWKARVARVAEEFIAGEMARRALAQPTRFEVRGGAEIAELGFRLTAEADRIDVAPDGTLYLYDYKTGAAPSEAEQRKFDKQLLLEAAIAEREGFEGMPPAKVSGAVFISLGSGKPEVPAPLDKVSPAEVWAEFVSLIAAYHAPETGFTSRRALQSKTDTGDYDQLARFGEWDITDDPAPEDLS